MKIEYSLPFRRAPRKRVFLVEPVIQSGVHAPRLARLLALAHKMSGLVQSGEVKHYRELAVLGHVSPPRVSQILLLLHLAPDIQERVLFLDNAEAQFLTEHSLRKIARHPRWNRQRVLFEALFDNRG